MYLLELILELLPKLLWIAQLRNFEISAVIYIDCNDCMLQR